MAHHRLHDDMDVIRHHTPGKQPVPIVIELQQRVLNDLGRARISQNATAQMLIEQVARVRLVSDSLYNVLRQAIGEPKVDCIDA